MNKIFIDRYLQATTNAFAENKLLKICFVLMLCVMLYNSHQINIAIKENKTIVIPAGTRTVFEVSDNHANHDYFLAMARYIVNLRGSLDFANVTNKLNELLLLAHPSDIQKIKEDFKKLESQYKRYPAVSHVVSMIENQKLEISDNRVLVKALKERIVGDSIIKKERISYIIKYEIVDNHFWLKGIVEVPENAK